MSIQPTRDELWRVAQRVMEQSGVREWQLDLDELEGMAEPMRARIIGPALKSLESLYIVVHECGHIALNHGNRELSVHRGEYEAEQFAQLVLRFLGYRVSAEFVQEGQDYVASHIDAAIERHRLTEIDRQSWEWAEVFVSQGTRQFVQTGQVRFVRQADAGFFERVLERFTIRHSEIMGGRVVTTSARSSERRPPSGAAPCENN